MKAGKKIRRKLAYSPVCVISMVSRTSFKTASFCSTAAGTRNLAESGAFW